MFFITSYMAQDGEFPPTHSPFWFIYFLYSNKYPVVDPIQKDYGK